MFSKTKFLESVKNAQPGAFLGLDTNRVVNMTTRREDFAASHRSAQWGDRMYYMMDDGSVYRHNTSHNYSVVQDQKVLGDLNWPDTQA